MTKITYNSSKMLNTTLNNIKNSNDNLKKAIEVTKQISGPLTYEEIDYLKSLSNELIKSSEILAKLSDWIVNNNNQYNSIIKNFEVDVNKIDSIAVKKREGYISHQ